MILLPSLDPCTDNSRDSFDIFTISSFSCSNRSMRAFCFVVLALAPQVDLSCCIFPQLPFRIPPPLVILIWIPLPLLLLTLLALQAQLPVQLILLLPLKLLLLLQLSLLILCPTPTPAAALVQFLLFLYLFRTSCAAGSAKLLPPRSC